MKKTSFQIVLILLLGLVGCSTTCAKKDLPAKKPVYQFAGKITVTPYKKNYSTNDTIWLSYETSDKMLLDSFTNKLINADTTYFVYSFAYRKQYAALNTSDTFYAAKYAGITNVQINRNGSLNNFGFYTECMTGGYQVKVGFIPKTAGIYSIDLLYGGGFNNCLNKINLFPFSAIRFKFDLADCNKDIYLSIPTAARINEQQTITLIDNKQSFVFKVL